MSKTFTIHKGKKSQVEDFINARAKMLEDLKESKHRLEEVESVNDVTYINDSGSTSVMSTLDSMRCISDPIIWILSSTRYDRDFILLSKIVRHKVKAIIVAGLEAQDVRSALSGGVPHFKITEDLESAALEAKGLAVAGDAVLFSPACAAGHLYKDVNERGTAYREIVKNLRSRL